VTGALTVVLIAYLIRLACLWVAMQDGSYLELSRGIWSLLGEILPVFWIAGVLMVGILVG